MMKYYLEITLLPDNEINLGFLWQRVFQQIHIALADNKLSGGTSAIGLSIPGYKPRKSQAKSFPLGDKIRLFADTEEALISCDINKWLERLIDYYHVRSIKSVPQDIKGYARFTRKNVVSPLKKAEKRAKHLGKPLNEIIEFMCNERQLAECVLPYINLESQKQTESGEKNRFRLFIDRTLLDKPVVGEFNCYGLSKTATVPWF